MKRFSGRTTIPIFKSDKMKTLKRVINLPGAFAVLLFYTFMILFIMDETDGKSKDKFIVVIPYASAVLWAVFLYFIIPWQWVVKLWN